MARKKIPGITRLNSGRYRARSRSRSRRKGYPIDSIVQVLKKMVTVMDDRQ